MSSNPLLSAAQWRAIAPLLPEKLRRDQHAIEAILFREFSGRSLTETSEIFAITRVRLHSWHNAIEADGSLRRIMAVLKLEPANPLARARTGERSRHHNNPEMVAAIAAIRMRGFRDALREGRR
jgi:hypothetical protein